MTDLTERRPVSRRLILTGGAAVAASTVIGPDPTPAFARRPRQWTATWATALMKPVPDDQQAHRGFEDQTLRQVVRVSAGGSRLRLRLAHPFGPDPITLGAVTVARRADGVSGASAEIDRDTLVQATFAGRPTTVVGPIAPARSDVIDFPLAAGGELVISIYLPTRTGPTSFHRRQHATGYVADGNQVDAAAGPYATEHHAGYLVQTVEVDGAGTAGLAVLGDSITEGIGTPRDANQRLTDQIARQLNGPDSSVAVANLGISGNKLLHDHDRFGDSGLHRFDRDVLDLPGVDTVLLALGVNDLQPPPKLPTPQQLLRGYRTLARRAHANGLRVIGATITPFKGQPKFSPELEWTRQRFNRRLRLGAVVDAVADFDRALRDPSDPARLRSQFRSTDWVHPNPDGTARWPLPSPAARSPMGSRRHARARPADRRQAAVRRRSAADRGLEQPGDERAAAVRIELISSRVTLDSGQRMPPIPVHRGHRCGVRCPAEGVVAPPHRRRHPCGPSTVETVTATE